MEDNYKNYPRGVADPLSSAAVVTPSDTTDLPFASRMIFLGTGGNLRVTMVDGMTITFVNILAGWHAIRATRVHASGTNAADIVIGA